MNECQMQNIQLRILHAANGINLSDTLFHCWNRRGPLQLVSLQPCRVVSCWGWQLGGMGLRQGHKRAGITRSKIFAP